MTSGLTAHMHLDENENPNGEQDVYEIWARYDDTGYTAFYIGRVGLWPYSDVGDLYEFADGELPRTGYWRAEPWRPTGEGCHSAPIFLRWPKSTDQSRGLR